MEDSSDDDKSLKVGLQSCLSIITSLHGKCIVHTNYIGHSLAYSTFQHDVTY